MDIHHKSAIIPLVERVSKAIITLKPQECKAQYVEAPKVSYTISNY